MVRRMLPWSRLASRGVAPFVLVLVALCAMLPGIARIPPIDRDEARFAQASRQMLETGNLVDIRFQAEARHKKPVGIYWLQAATVSAAEALGVPQARQRIAVYRLPSLIGAIAAVLLTYWAGLPLVGPRAAFFGGLAMAVSILLNVEARLAKTDAVLLATILLMQGVLARAYLAPDGMIGRGFRAVWPFWAGLAAGTLVKGPLGILVAGLTAVPLVTAERRVRWLAALRPRVGVPLALLLVVPWFVVIGIQSGGAFFTESVGRDMLAKVGSGQEAHWAPPLTYLAVVWGTFWPASIFLPAAALAAWRGRREREVRFLVAWIVPCWILFELVPTKLPHYVLPLYPALALLVGRFLADDAAAIGRAGRLVATALLLVGGIGLPVAIFAAAWWLDGHIAFRMAPFFLAGAIFVWLAVRALRADARRLGFAWAVATALATYAGVLGIGLPEVRSVWISPRLADAARNLPCVDPLLATAGFREPSLVFLTRTDLVMTDGAGAARFLAEGGCRAAFVERREEAAFDAALAQAGLAPALVTRVRGININGGRRLDIAVRAVYPTP